MNVLVTGADGLLGGNLTRELLAQGASVRVLVHPKSTSTSLRGLPIEVVTGDVTVATEVEGACRGIDYVFHCAAITDLFAEPDLVWNVNVGGTANVIDACLATGVRRLLHVGSASSFQFGSAELPGTEAGQFPAAYRGIPYMESKFAAMRLVLEAVRDRGLDAVVLAPTFMLGPNDTGPSSGTLIAEYIKRGLRLVSPGGRNFVHVCDVASAAVAAIRRGKSGQAYLLAGENLSYRKFFSMVASIAGVAAPVATLPAAAIRGAGLAGGYYERLSGKRAPLNDQLAEFACQEVYYSPARAIDELGLTQTPISAAIAASLASLRALGHLAKGRDNRRSPNQTFAGKTALISGGSRGLGYALAVALAERGANIVITARGAERLESSRSKLESLGANVAAVCGDVGNWEDATRMVDAAVTRFGGIDIVLNNAGVSMRGEFRDLSPEMCTSVIQTNLLGAVNLSRAAVQSVAARAGSIVFISSIAGLFGLPGASVYCASKGAMRGLSESMRLELHRDGVHVGIVNLGFTEHDPDKRILAADGAPLLPDRPAHHTQRQAALQIVTMLEKRSRELTLTPVGKLGALAYRLSPGLVERSILYAQSGKWRAFRQFS